jgi:hypothetical protein
MRSGTTPLSAAAVRFIDAQNANSSSPIRPTSSSAADFVIRPPDPRGFHTQVYGSTRVCRRHPARSTKPLRR